MEIKEPLLGRHYETGTIINALSEMGCRDPKTKAPYSEALALGVSGGIAFGHFVFAYGGCLPHVALLPRNTFDPFLRALDNLAIRRETRETTDAAKGEKNLKEQLDLGNPVIVWADIFSMPYRGLNPKMMWAMLPVLVLGYSGSTYQIADGSERVISIDASDLAKARARVKKDRFKIMVLEAPDEERIAAGLRNGLSSSAALFLDKPPAGSVNNFGIAGMRHWAKLLTDDKNAKSWAKSFLPGAPFVQALAGEIGQPGVWDWIEGWGSGPAADRGTYAMFLREAFAWLGDERHLEAAEAFSRSAPLWSQLAEASMPEAVPEFAALKPLKRRHRELWQREGTDSLQERAAIRAEMRPLTEAAAESPLLAEMAPTIRASMAGLISKIADIEGPAAELLRVG